jgi:CheY-like chemotaxis protein
MTCAIPHESVLRHECLRRGSPLRADGGTVARGDLGALRRFEVVEAADGDEALRRARDDRPSIIFLDLGLRDMTGFQVLDQLQSDIRTRDIPVIIHTSRRLDAAERGLLDGRVVAILQ